MPTFEDVTELAGMPISQEQLYRMFNRYNWTANYSQGADVLEVACGAGQGVGYIGRQARSVIAGDISEQILAHARAHYGARYQFLQMDAQELPFKANSFDVVVIHEALYYVPDAAQFVAEANRVLRPNGRLLITNSNKDIFDFNPSPHHTTYHGVTELVSLLEAQGFVGQYWGSQPLSEISTVQKLTRPLKRLAVSLGLVPKTMRGKQVLKRIIFGKPVAMPPEIQPGMAEVENLEPLSPQIACTSHKIIYCHAQRIGEQT